jgi:hypothetical protein
MTSEELRIGESQHVPRIRQTLAAVRIAARLSRGGRADRPRCRPDARGHRHSRTDGDRAVGLHHAPGKLDLPERTRHDRAMRFEILGDIYDIETFATGAGIREIARLRRIYGRGRWRKRKGIARVRLSDGSIHTAELHWYEATGIGRKEFKIKHLL